MFINLIITVILFSGLIYLLNSKFPDVLENKQNYFYILQMGVIISLLILWYRKSDPKIIIRNVSIWLGVVLLALTGYSYQYDLKQYAEKIFGNLNPSMGISGKDNSVTFYTSQNGHFMINTEVNGKPIKFLLDTGASKVTLTANDAKRIGIDLDSLNFDIKISTANGIVNVAGVKLKEIRIDSIVVHDVEAYVNRQDLDVSLLGMSFLNKLRRYEVQSNAITFWN